MDATSLFRNICAVDKEKNLQVIGYSRVLARDRINQEATKPFFGSPYIKIGQCLMLWSYFFQLGGMLGSKYSSELGPFALVFLGAHGEEDKITEFLCDLIQNKIEYDDSMSFFNYTTNKLLKKAKTKITLTEFLKTVGNERMDIKNAKEIALEFTMDGVALGAVSLEIINGFYSRTYCQTPKHEWTKAHLAGLNIPPQQDIIPYEDALAEEDNAFITYCAKLYEEMLTMPSRRT
jgi:hypothetical protein